MPGGKKNIESSVAKLDGIAALQKFPRHGRFFGPDDAIHLAGHGKTFQKKNFLGVRFQRQAPGACCECIAKNVVEVAMRIDEPHRPQVLFADKTCQRLSFGFCKATRIKNGAFARVVVYYIGVFCKRTEFKSLYLRHIFSFK